LSPRKTKRTYCVYVVDLDPAVWRARPKMRKSNPKYKPLTGPGFLYVGMTMHTPEQRFETHKAGGKLSSAVVRKYGIRLRPTLYRAYKRMSLEDAEEMEVYVADRLRKKGYAVWPVKPGGAFSMKGES
jgi:hypothetical protein